MSLSDLSDRGPLRPLLHALGGGLSPGEVGVVRARAGSGKTALVLQFALDRLLRGEAVLHIAGTGTIDQVRDGYESLLDGLGRPLRPAERTEARLFIERHRIIPATRGAVPDVARLKHVLDQLADVVEFQPVLVVVDGWEPEAASFDALSALAKARNLTIWCTGNSEPLTEDASGDAVGDVVLDLVPERSHVMLHVRKLRAAALPAPLRLDTATFTARAAEAADAHPRTVAEVTLYSGGAAGAEAAFGEAAERHGAREVNYTFTGHVQARTRGAHPLTEQELQAGDVSLAYVSRRLRREYAEGSQIRRVLQSLWHQVGNAQVVYVVGAIQEDGTVTGGTGWSVELARMWSKRLWVFDQDKGIWFRWNGEDWVEGTPKLDATTICGTGTRYLSESGRQAIEDLFARSFVG